MIRMSKLDKIEIIDLRTFWEKEEIKFTRIN
ncbi:hypothetical protein WKT22_00513 [Candidatus Lokiarchaeum ossiferum]